MNRAALILCCGLLAMVLSCTGSPSAGFGPFPSSVFGNTTAGVAGFVQTSGPGAGQFAIVVVNSDSTNTYDVTVTPPSGVATIKQVLPCEVGNFVANCTDINIIIKAANASLATPASIVINPNASCSQQLVFIAIATITGSNGATTTTATLTQTPPASLANCPGLATTVAGAAGTSTGLGMGGGFGGFGGTP